MRIPHKTTGWVGLSAAETGLAVAVTRWPDNDILEAVFWFCTFIFVCWLALGIFDLVRWMLSGPKEAASPTAPSAVPQTVGQWHDNRFVYHQPLLVFTAVVTEADNNKPKVFEVNGPEPESFVDFRVVIDALHGRVQAILDFPKGRTPFNWAGWHAGIRQGFRLPKNRLMTLRTNTVKDTDPTVVRVYVASWQIGPESVAAAEDRELTREVMKIALREDQSEESKRLLLAKLRGEGTQIRNFPFTVDHMVTAQLDEWIARINSWMTEAIEAIKYFSEADAEFLATLRNVPPATVDIPNIRLGGSEDRARYLKAFREHDFRLDRFERMCTKHGVGV